VVREAGRRAGGFRAVERDRVAVVRDREAVEREDAERDPLERELEAVRPGEAARGRAGVLVAATRRQ
jgi:hypothetical protein